MLIYQNFINKGYINKDQFKTGINQTNDDNILNFFLSIIFQIIIQLFLILLKPEKIKYFKNNIL